jgi:glyoxylase-like metal-dependent hydrolase (beta-lactamase superfamily II)
VIQTGLRTAFAAWCAPNPLVEAWVRRPPGDAVQVIDRDPRVLQVKTPRGNTYLILGDGVTVLDPNLPGEDALVRAALEPEGLGLDDVAWVGCTHLHFDHASGLDAVARACDARLLLSRTVQPFVDGDRPYPFPETRPSAWPFLDVWGRVGFPGIVRSQIREGGHIGYPWSDLRLRTERTRWFEPGEACPELGGLLPVHTPGHCPDHVCYLHEATGTLLSGDQYITVRGYIETNRIIYDREALAASDRELRAMGVRTICPGHGPVMHL